MTVVLSIVAVWVALDVLFVAAVVWLRSGRRARRIARRRGPGYLHPSAAARPITTAPASGRKEQP